MISERFRIIKSLGKGGMGEVFMAEDEALSQTVAIKVLNANASDDAKVRFQTEAKAMASLCHSVIVKVNDFGFTEEDKLYMVQEYVKGRTLDKVLKNEGLFEVSELIEIALQISEGLEYAHQNQILHRDIKPSNIILSKEDESYRVKILDFGLAKLQEKDQKLTGTGVVAGTPLYMSPEQCQAQETDERSDIYSLGCLIFEMMCGQPPFKGETVLETIKLKLNSKAPSVTSVLPEENVPASLDRLVSKCLELKPADRYSSVAEVSQALKNLENQITQEEESEEEDQSNRVKKNQSFLSSTTLVVVVLSGVIMALTGGAFLLLKPEETKQNDAKKVQVPEKISVDVSLLAEYYPDSEFKKALRKSPIKLRPLGFNIKLNDSQLKRLKSALLKRDKPKLVSYRIDLSGSQLTSLIPVKLRELQLLSCKISDFTIDKIARMDSLERLDIKTPGVSEKQTIDFAAFSNLKNLNRLEITGTRITDHSVDHLKPLKSIENLNLRFCSVDSGSIDLSALTELPDLSVLEIEGPDFREGCISSLSNCQKLETLTVASPFGNKLKPILKDVEKVPNLSTLRLQSCKLEVDSLASIRLSKSLSVLDLFKVECTDPDAIKDIATLNRIKIKDCMFSDQAWQQISKLDNLKEMLLISGESLPKSFWQSLNNLKNLETLKLRVVVPDDGYSSIVKLPKLKRLVLHKDMIIPAEYEIALEKKAVAINRANLR